MLWHRYGPIHLINAQAKKWNYPLGVQSFRSEDSTRNNADSERVRVDSSISLLGKSSRPHTKRTEDQMST
jgi:hypothetical protein